MYSSPATSYQIVSEIYDRMTYADIILTCSDSHSNQKPVAHKAILASCSDFLKMLLEGNPDSHELIIPEISTNTMISILTLVYTGKVCLQNQTEISEVVQGIKLLGISSVIKEMHISSQEEFEMPTGDEGLAEEHEESENNAKENWPPISEFLCYQNEVSSLDDGINSNNLNFIPNTQIISTDHQMEPEKKFGKKRKALLLLKGNRNLTFPVTSSLLENQLEEDLYHDDNFSILPFNSESDKMSELSEHEKQALAIQTTFDDHSYASNAKKIKFV